MPKLVLFAPCERVVIDAEDNSLSIMSLLQTVGVSAHTNVEDPKIVIPLKWSTIALWYKEPADDEIEFRQRLEVIAPSGKAVVSQETTFKMGKPFHRQMTKAFGLNVPEDGEYTFRLSLLTGAGWQTKAEYPLRVSVTLTVNPSLPA